MENKQIKIPDWAKWNYIRDYKKVKVAGINYVILKAINKSNKKDGRFEEHISGCSEAGIEVYATYHYTYASNVQEAVAAANKWLEAVAGRCRRFILDYEDASLYKGGCAAIAVIQAYANIIQQTGYEFYVYMGLSDYNSYFRKDADKLPYKMWIARYYKGYTPFDLQTAVNEKYKPAIGKSIVGWQYTSVCAIDGVDAPCDVSMWYEDIEAHTSVINNIEHNPYMEPQQNVKMGTCGNDADWVLWYLWRFGKLLNEVGQADAAQINGDIDRDNTVQIREVQRLLGISDDGIMGPITRAVFKKIC
ncbi:MAG: hypothetical protein NC337_02165 [Roseburia sp.]|nr:hypothetical protein [Roseburia sp.]